MNHHRRQPLVAFILIVGLTGVDFLQMVRASSQIQGRPSTPSALPVDDFLRGAIGTIRSLGHGVKEEIQFHLTPLERYRTHVLSRLRYSLDCFGAERHERGLEWTHGTQAQAERNERLHGVLSVQSHFAKILVHPEDAAERLRRVLERNQRELQRQLNKANSLLVSAAVQASAEDRRAERVLEKLRGKQRALISDVKTKTEARLQRAALDSQIQSVRNEWAERQAALGERLQRRQQLLADKMRSIAADSNVLARLYEARVQKRRAGRRQDTQVLNEATFQRAMALILEDEEEGDWEHVTTTRAGNLTVQRKFVGSDSRAGQYACVRAWCTMDVPAQAIAELFESSDRVAEYNKWFREGRDLEVLDEDTKVVWAACPPVFRFVKPRDFVTVVHYRRFDDGSLMVVNRAVSHPDAPPTDEYVRGEIILAANLIRPDATNKKRAHFTMLTQVDPGGFAPAWIVNKVSAKDPVDFLERVEASAGVGAPRPGKSEARIPSSSRQTARQASKSLTATS